MGASAAGKSLLLQTLSGRVQDLTLSGEVKMNGEVVNPKRLDNPVAYVPQEDSLIGELTAREVTINTAVLKRNDPMNMIQVETSQLLDSLGLTKVADGFIGTMIFVSFVYACNSFMLIVHANYYTHFVLSIATAWPQWWPEEACGDQY